MIDMVRVNFYLYDSGNGWIDLYVNGKTYGQILENDYVDVNKGDKVKVIAHPNFDYELDYISFNGVKYETPILEKEIQDDSYFGIHFKPITQSQPQPTPIQPYETPVSSYGSCKIYEKEAFGRIWYYYVTQDGYQSDLYSSIDEAKRHAELSGHCKPVKSSDERLDELENKVSSLEQKQSELSDSINEVSSKVDELSKSVEDLRKVSENLNTLVSDLSDKVSELEKTLSENVKRLEDMINENRVNIDDTNESLKNLSDRVDLFIQGIEDKIINTVVEYAYIIMDKVGSKEVKRVK